jgi:hypothetical protein
MDPIVFQAVNVIAGAFPYCKSVCAVYYISSETSFGSKRDLGILGSTDLVSAGVLEITQIRERNKVEGILVIP